jgi:hypothetical protein
MLFMDEHCYQVPILLVCHVLNEIKIEDYVHVLHVGITITTSLKINSVFQK